jgi:hypothetical protein
MVWPEALLGKRRRAKAKRRRAQAMGRAQRLGEWGRTVVGRQVFISLFYAVPTASVPLAAYLPI